MKKEDKEDLVNLISLVIKKRRLTFPDLVKNLAKFKISEYDTRQTAQNMLEKGVLVLDREMKLYINHNYEERQRYAT